MVGLLAVLFAEWSNDAQIQFSRLIAGHAWLALLITPALITAIVFSGLVSLALAGNYLYFGQISAPNLFPISFALPVVIAAVVCGTSFIIVMKMINGGGLVIPLMAAAFDEQPRCQLVHPAIV